MKTVPGPSSPASPRPLRLSPALLRFAAAAVLAAACATAAAQLSAATGQQWIIENRPGAGGLLAIEAVMRAPADGYTLLIASQNVPVTRRYLSRSKPIEPTADLTPVSALWRTTLVIASHPSFQAKSLKELIAYARGNPGKVSFGTSGIGTQAHFAGASLSTLAGAPLTHIPYANGRQVTETVAGDVPVVINIVSPVLPHVRSGRLRPLAVAGYKRLEVLPEVPTVSEVLPKFEPPPTWTGLFGPARLPGQIVARLHAAVEKAVATPELRAKGAADGFELIGNTPDQFAAQLKRDIEVAGRLVKAAKVEPTD
jgi:tripartite-type tricarboxylate transporter receptor subunit TctC